MVCAPVDLMLRRSCHSAARPGGCRAGSAVGHPAALLGVQLPPPISWQQPCRLLVDGVAVRCRLRSEVMIPHLPMPRYTADDLAQTTMMTGARSPTCLRDSMLSPPSHRLCSTARPKRRSNQRVIARAVLLRVAVLTTPDPIGALTPERCSTQSRHLASMDGGAHRFVALSQPL